MDQNEPGATDVQRGEPSSKGNPSAVADNDEATSEQLLDRTPAIYQAGMHRNRRTSGNPQPIVPTSAIAKPYRKRGPKPRPVSHVAAQNLLAHVWMESCGWDGQLYSQESIHLMDLSSVTSFKDLFRQVGGKYDASDLRRVKHVVMESCCNSRIP